MTERRASGPVGQRMARAKLAAILDAAGILDAISFARVRGSSQATLVGVDRVNDERDEESEKRGNDDESLFQNVRHCLNSTAPRYAGHWLCGSRDTIRRGPTGKCASEGRVVLGLTTGAQCPASFGEPSVIGAP